MKKNDFLRKVIVIVIRKNGIKSRSEMTHILHKN